MYENRNVYNTTFEFWLLIPVYSNLILITCKKQSGVWQQNEIKTEIRSLKYQDTHWKIIITGKYIEF